MAELVNSTNGWDVKPSSASDNFLAQNFQNPSGYADRQRANQMRNVSQIKGFRNERAHPFFGVRLQEAFDTAWNWGHFS